MLNIKGVTKKINKKIILENISFKVNKGDVIGIVGENGSGKSTLLKIILGIFEKTEGLIEKTSVVLEYFPDVSNMVNNIKVIDFIKHYCVINNLEKEESQARIKKMTSKFNLESKLNSNMKTLSTGEKKRIYILTMLLFKKDVILFDEPTDNLDETYNKIFLEVIASLMERQVSLLIVSHDQVFLEKIINKLIILQDKKILYLGSFKKGQKIKEIWEEANTTNITSSKGEQNVVTDSLINW